MDHHGHKPTAQAGETKPNLGTSDPSGLRQATLRQLGRLDIHPAPLLAILNAPSDDPERVTHALHQSAALSARVLSVTNSAAIGVVGEINDIHRAVLHMGAARARLIAMAFGLHMLAQETGLNPEVSHHAWVNSLEKAYLAKHVAEATDPKQAEQAYTLGLIQDLGLLALMAVDQTFYKQLDQSQGQNEPLHFLEQQHFGIDHAQAGNHLLLSWNTSPLLCEEVLNHHHPILTRKDSSPANLGNLIAGMLPHDCEALTPDRMEQLVSAHSQFLTSAYDTPESMIHRAVRSAREVHGTASSVSLDGATKLRMLGEIESNTVGMVRQLCDIEGQLNHQHEQVHALRFEAMTDSLTQVLNRRGFNRLAERRIHNAAERGLPICAVMIDLNGFKQINDTYGHDAGDQMLIEVARHFRDNIDSSDLFGRIGGDEFAILQLNVDQETAKRIIQRVANACMRRPVNLGEDGPVPLKFSMGAAYCSRPTERTQIADLLSAADEEMYINKRNGTGGITFVEYHPRRQAS